MSTITRLKARSLNHRELEWALRAEAVGIDGSEQAIALLCSQPRDHFAGDAIWEFIKVDVTTDGEPIAWVQWGHVIDRLEGGELNLPVPVTAVWRCAAHLATGIPFDMDACLNVMAVDTADLARRLLTGGAA